MQHNTISVQVTRGGQVESSHQIIGAIVTSNGERLHTWGDLRQPVYPRSAIKALQALAMIESGAAAHYGFSPEEIALCCASHTGEPQHVAAVNSMLEKMALTESHLSCGCHWPTYPQAAYDLAGQQGKPDQRHNNCSGKHAGMLALAQWRGDPLTGYIDVNHPVQQTLARTMGELCGIDFTGCAWSPDGCSAPTWAIPLDHLALGFARFADPSGLSTERQAACRTLFQSVVSAPFMVAGTGRYCTDMMGILGDRVFLKVGAEGVYIAAIPELQLAIALKCLDGATRAAEVVMTGLLDLVGITRNLEDGRLAAYRTPAIKNWRGLHTGNLECQWP